MLLFRPVSKLFFAQFPKRVFQKEVTTGLAPTKKPIFRQRATEDVTMGPPNLTLLCCLPISPAFGAESLTLKIGAKTIRGKSPTLSCHLMGS